MFCFCCKYSIHSCSVLLWGLLRLPVLKNALLPLWEISQPFEINLSSDRFYFYAVTHLTTGLLRLVQERTDTSTDSTTCGRCEGSLGRHGCPTGRCSPGPGSGSLPHVRSLATCASATPLGPNTTWGTCDTPAFRPSASQQWSSKGQTKSP